MINRRSFIKKTGMSTIGLGILGTNAVTTSIGCTEHLPTAPEVPLEAIIKGPSTMRIPNTVKFDGSESKGNIKKYSWGRKNDSSDNEYTPRGTDQILEDTLTEAGHYDYKLVVENATNKTSEAFHSFDMLPALFTNQIWFYEVTGKFNEKHYELNTMDPDTYETKTVLVGTTDLSENLNNSTLGKSPDGKYLVLGKSLGQYGHYHNLYLYDIQTGEIAEDKLVDTPGISWQATWSPKGDLIAYVDDYRYPSRARDELFLVNPITKERTFLASNDSKEEMDRFTGFYPAWNPMGDEIALGATRYLYDDKMVRRISIYSNLFGKPERRPLHSEEQIQSFLEERFGVNFRIDEGINGVAWSPDDTLIAYNVIGSFDSPIPENTIFIARADGSGIENIISLDRPLVRPTWSPDSQKLLFNAFTPNYGGQELWMCDRNGKNTVNLTPTGKKYTASAWTK